MRKTRLVILPTKCLHQMGFLLLFLSCPVIGDWGRIRPESENSHKAIQIQREGTCGLQRDPPGGLLDVLKENGPRQCQLSEDHDLIKSTQESIPEMSFARRIGERRVDSWRTNQRRAFREERDVRTIESRRERTVRSRSVETRRSRVRSPERSERVRSLSLSRLENERTARGQRNDLRDIRREPESNTRRLSLTRRANERQEERRMEQRRLYRETRNERREDDGRTHVERAERVSERRGTRREDTDRSTPRLSMNRRQNEAARLTRERNQRDVRERNERRLSLSRMEQDNRRMERQESRRNLERMPREETRSARRTRSAELSRNNMEREETVRISRNFDVRRETESRRLVSLSPKRIARVASLDRKTERTDGIRETRAMVDTASPALNDDLENEKNEGFFEGLAKWADMKDYESPRIGDWTTNCVVGAVTYFLTSRQVKTV